MELNFHCNSTIVPAGSYWFPKYNSKLFTIGVPTNYKPSGKVVWHFHGWRQPYRDADADFKLIPWFNLLDSIPQDTLLVAPVGRMGPSKYSLGNDFHSCRNIIDILDQVKKTTTDAFWTEVTLSGHSAAGSVMLPLLRGGTLNLAVRNVFLFDAMYSSDVGPFNEFVARKQNKLMAASRPDSNVYAHSTRIDDSNNNVHIVKSATPDHYEVVRKCFPIFMDLVRRT